MLSIFKGSNANTVDSGIVVGSSGSQSSLHTAANQQMFCNSAQQQNLTTTIINSVDCPPNNSLCVFSSRNYEWLRLLASRVVAFHNCHLYCAASCSIPEFVRNIVAYLLTSPLLRHTRYAANICGDTRKWELATLETASLNVNPVELFRELVLIPLKDVCSGLATLSSNNGNFFDNFL